MLELLEQVVKEVVKEVELEVVEIMVSGDKRVTVLVLCCGPYHAVILHASACHALVWHAMLWCGMP